MTLGEGARYAQDRGVIFELIVVRYVVERAMGRVKNGTISGHAATARIGLNPHAQTGRVEKTPYKPVTRYKCDDTERHMLRKGVWSIGAISSCGSWPARSCAF